MIWGVFAPKPKISRAQEAPKLRVETTRVEILGVGEEESAAIDAFHDTVNALLAPRRTLIRLKVLKKERCERHTVLAPAETDIVARIRRMTQ